MKKGRIAFYLFCTAVVILALIFRNNAPLIYASIGDYYYRHNNVSRAQAFYEKSFALGNTDSDLREAYVNSIINSPLTLESQEKLVNIAEGKHVDGASVKSKYFLYDLQREIHRKYPENYIKQAPYNQKIVRWNKFPITYKFKKSQNVPDEFIKEINLAFSEWERYSNIIFSETNSDNANIIIDFEDNQSNNYEYGQKYVVAYTTPQININTLEHMVIKFYICNLNGELFSPNQIYNTALHEIFHALGFMGHSFNKENIMYLAKDSQNVIDDTKDSLTEADINTLQLLYKIKPDITNKGDLKSEYMPYLVIGDDESVSISKAREAKHYINKAPTLPSGYIDLAESFVAQKKYPSAIRSLEKALQLADTNDVKYVIYYNLAVSYFYIDHMEMALDNAQKAFEINDTEEIHYLFAEIYTKQDVKKAIQEYNFLINQSPQNIDYAINLTNIYIRAHDYINARKTLKSFIKANPQEKGNLRLSPYKILIF